MSAQQFEEVTINIPGVRSGASAWGDFDEDGDYDVLQGGYDLNNGRGLTVLIATNSTFEAGQSWPLGFSPAAAWADFDGDGDLDFASGGYSVLITGQILNHIYRNDSGTFTPIAPEINAAGVPFWADMDRDGDLDLIFAGISLNDPHSSDLEMRRWRVFLNRPGKPWLLAYDRGVSSNARAPIVADWNHDGWPDLALVYPNFDGDWILQVQVNSPNLAFSQKEIPFGDIDAPYSGVWGDYDNDGDFDLAFNGERRFANRILKFVRNNGDSFSNFLVEQTTGLGIAWADFNSDGYLDLTITDSTEDGFVAPVRHYPSLGAFAEPFFSTPIDLPLRGASFSAISSVDFDVDGDQDMMITGFTNGVPSTRLFRNLLNTSNPPPTIPTQLSAVVGTNNTITLSWSASSDFNQSGGLSYNVWIRRTDSAHFLVPPNANTNTGQLFVPQYGNAGVLTNLVLSNLLAGTYHWSVQSIDNSFASSPFASSAEFTVNPGLPRIEEFNVSDIYHEHVSFTSEVIGNGSDTTVWFDYGTDSNLTFRTPPASIGSSIRGLWTTNEVTDLLTAQTYSVRAVASNSVGIVYSATNNFFTTNQPPSISAPATITWVPGSTSGPVVITVSDLETAPENLHLSIAFASTPGVPQNTNLLSLDDIQIEVSGSNRLVTLNPPTDEYGFIRLLFTLTDEHGGTRTRSVSYVVNVFNRIGTLDDGGDSLAAVDVNSDGLFDLLGNRRWTRNTNGSTFVFVGLVIGNFTAYSDLALDDIDNDGTVDLAFSTRVSNAPQTKIFTNSPNLPLLPHAYRAVTQDLSPDFLIGVLSFTDFDLDGDADLFASGTTNNTTAGYTGVVWRNDGDKTFSSLDDVFPRLYNAALVWTDYNQDGAPDLLLLGVTNRQNNFPYTELLLNNGFGNFVPSGAALPPHAGGTAQWGDFNTDGRPDLVICSRATTRFATNTVALYQNMADGSFLERARFEPVVVNELFLADFNNDGALDLMYEGDEEPLFPSSSTKIYLNKGNWNFDDASPMTSSFSTSYSPPFAFADFNRDGIMDLAGNSFLYLGAAFRTNEPPTAPTNLVVTFTNSHILLAWDPATDSAQTNGLTYNVRLSTTPGGVDIISPLSLPDGRRLVAQPGNAFHSLKRMVRNLPPGTYYWSVQAVDNSMDGGPFAPEQTFTIASAEPNFLSIENDGTTIRLVLEAPASGSLIVEASADLLSWTPVQTNTPPTNTITVTPSAEQTATFYRAVLLP